MKPEHFCKATTLLLLTFAFQFSFASGGNIMGQVKDAETKEPVSFANVILVCQGSQTAYTTNENGYYYASNIPAGRYSIIVSYMSTKDTTLNVKVASDETKQVDINFGSAHTIGAVDIVWKKDENPPLLNFMEPQTQIVTGTAIREMPITKITEVLGTTAGVVEMGGNSYVHGARADATQYYIDQCKVMGNPNIPICGVAVMRIYDNFIPAKYGDSIGGVVVIETRSLYTE